MFLFFSNRLGCGGSLLVSLVITAILLIIFVFWPAAAGPGV